MVSAKVKGKETGRVRKRQRVRSYLQVLGCMVGLGLVNGCSDKNQRQFHSTILKDKREKRLIDCRSVKAVPKELHLSVGFVKNLL